MAKINDVLDAEVRNVLKGQVEHLLELSHRPDSEFHKSSEWKLRYDGAKTVMELIESEIGLGRNSGLGIVINAMPLDDLKRYKKLFDDRITEFESEPKVTIFGVRTGDVTMHWKRTKKEANDSLKELMEEEMEDDEYSCEFGIDPKSVFESEVKEYIRE